MVIAWVLLSSIGIVASRHCKNMLESKLFLNVKLWFQVMFEFSSFFSQGIRNYFLLQVLISEIVFTSRV